MRSVPDSFESGTPEQPSPRTAHPEDTSRPRQSKFHLRASFLAQSGYALGFYGSGDFQIQGYSVVQHFSRWIQVSWVFDAMHLWNYAGVCTPQLRSVV